MNKSRIKAFWVIVITLGIVYFITKGETENKGFVLGLDLAGGSSLTYKIDTSVLPEGADITDSVASLRDVVERRVNLFGVREPSVTTSYSRLSKEWRLIVELPGITDVMEASKMIGETPVLDFRTQKPGATADTNFLEAYERTPLSGRYLEKSSLVFDPTTNRPMVELTFNEEGGDLFAKITKLNIGKQIAIFLDGVPISAPNVNEEITGGKAVISGNFTIEEAKTLVGRLNAGALPMPISLSGTTVVGPTLGDKAVNDGVRAAVIGFVLVVIFMIVWYRLPGITASLALVFYSAFMLMLFKLIPVTLTSSGIAGFIISIGLAVDANVLTFERMKEELRSGKSLKDSVEIGFTRAWTSIRDSHTAAIIVSVILFFMGTSVVKGFAFTFFLGAVISLISAQLVTRVFVRALVTNSQSKIIKFLFGSGVSLK